MSPKTAVFASLIVPAVVALILKLFVFEFLVISGKSMEPVIADGTIAILNKSAYGIFNPFNGNCIKRTGRPAEGDIVVYPYSGKYVVKRYAFSEGKPVTVKGEKGSYTLIVAGSEFPLTDAQYRHFVYVQSVPSGMFFAVGDNLAESVDSRDYGFVAESAVRGKIILSAGKKTNE